MPQELLTVKEAAKQLRVTEIYIYEMIKSRRIGVILVGKKRYFTQAIIDKYLDDHTYPPKQEE